MKERDQFFAGLCNLVCDIAERSGRSEQTVADCLLVSRPTLQRWRKGKHLPMPATRAAMIRALVSLEEVMD